MRTNREGCGGLAFVHNNNFLISPCITFMDQCCWVDMITSYCRLSRANDLPLSCDKTTWSVGAVAVVPTAKESASAKVADNFMVSRKREIRKMGMGGDLLSSHHLFILSQSV